MRHKLPHPCTPDLQGFLVIAWAGAGAGFSKKPAPPPSTHYPAHGSTGAATQGATGWLHPRDTFPLSCIWGFQMQGILCTNLDFLPPKSQKLWNHRLLPTGQQVARVDARPPLRAGLGSLFPSSPELCTAPHLIPVDCPLEAPAGMSRVPRALTGPTPSGPRPFPFMTFCGGDTGAQVSWGWR